MIKKTLFLILIALILFPGFSYAAQTVSVDDKAGYFRKGPFYDASRDAIRYEFNTKSLLKSKIEYFHDYKLSSVVSTYNNTASTGNYFGSTSFYCMGYYRQTMYTENGQVAIQFVTAIGSRDVRGTACKEPLPPTRPPTSPPDSGTSEPPTNPPTKPPDPGTSEPPITPPDSGYWESMDPDCNPVTGKCVGDSGSGDDVDDTVFMPPPDWPPSETVTGEPTWIIGTQPKDMEQNFIIDRDYVFNGNEMNSENKPGWEGGTGWCQFKDGIDDSLKYDQPCDAVDRGYGDYQGSIWCRENSKSEFIPCGPGFNGDRNNYEIAYSYSGMCVDNRIDPHKGYPCDGYASNMPPPLDDDAGDTMDNPTKEEEDSCGEACKIFECPGWDEYLEKLDQIKDAIPPPPNWQNVSEIFRDTIAPQIKADMAELIGSAPEPVMPNLPEAPDLPSEPIMLEDVRSKIELPTGKEAPGLEDSTFTEDDIKNSAPIIQEREDPTGGFKIDNPIDGLPSQEEFIKNAPIEGVVPLPDNPKDPENISPTPGDTNDTAPVPGDTGNTAPIPGNTNNTAPIPNEGGKAPIPGDDKQFTAPIP